MEGFLVYLLIFAVYLVITLRRKKGKSGKESQGRLSRRTPARASDGHILRGKNDITCRQFGHHHEEDSAPRYIVHDDPEDGFIILNGVKMRISEADQYENNI